MEINTECQIKDDDEILEEENNRYNFRRFTPEEIHRKHSPFERVSKKKEIPFLFQKKKYSPKLDSKISLEDIMNKIEKLDLSGNTFISNTPPYPPYSHPPSPVPEMVLDESVLKNTNEIHIDG